MTGRGNTPYDQVLGPIHGQTQPPNELAPGIDFEVLRAPGPSSTMPSRRTMAICLPRSRRRPRSASPKPIWLTKRPPADMLSPEVGLPATDAMSGPLTGQSVWVVDAHSLILQVFHAIPEMTSPRGEPVGAVFGFTRDLLYPAGEEEARLSCSVAFDLPGRRFATTLYDEYKVQRGEMPERPACRRFRRSAG